MENSAGQVFQSWIDPPRSGAWNMKRDRQLLYGVEATELPVTVLRLYGWDRPTISIGRNQDPVDAVDTQFCQKSRIPVIRRPTGGRAVLHSEEVTYSIVSNDGKLFPKGSLLECYRKIAAVLQDALERLGVQCEVAPASHSRGVSRRKRSPCFAAASRYELLRDGRKIAGNAQHRLRRSFLQHGSIPLNVDYELYGNCLGVPPPTLQQTMISVSEAAGHQVRFQEVAAALKDSLADYLRVQDAGG